MIGGKTLLQIAVIDFHYGRVRRFGIVDDFTIALAMVFKKKLSHAYGRRELAILCDKAEKELDKRFVRTFAIEVGDSDLVASAALGMTCGS